MQLHEVTDWPSAPPGIKPALASRSAAGGVKTVAEENYEERMSLAGLGDDYIRRFGQGNRRASVQGQQPDNANDDPSKKPKRPSSGEPPRGDLPQAKNHSTQRTKLTSTVRNRRSGGTVGHSRVEMSPPALLSGGRDASRTGVGVRRTQNGLPICEDRCRTVALLHWPRRFGPQFLVC